MGAFPAAYVAYRKQRFAEADHQLERDKEDHRREEAAAASVGRIREIEAANERADAKGFADRFTIVTGQMGSDKAPVRLAGMYAMAQLADEWGRTELSQRQVCVEVLCAYLRMPWSVADGADGSSVFTDEGDTRLNARAMEEGRVREQVIRLIAWRLQAPETLPDGVSNWSDMRLDFTEGRLPACDFSGSNFGAVTSFKQVTFAGVANFRNSVFAGSAMFDGATFSEGAAFDGAVIHGAGKFELAKFGEPPTPDLLEFASYPAIYGRNLISSVVPEAAASFHGTMFRSNASFGGAKFDAAVDFGETVFDSTATFQVVEVNGEWHMRDARFIGQLEISRSQEKMATNLVLAGSTFNASVTMNEVTIEGQADFSSCLFSDTFTSSDFHSSRFIFDSCTFSDTFVLMYPYDGVVSFLYARFSGDIQIVLSDSKGLRFGEVGSAASAATILGNVSIHAMPIQTGSVQFDSVSIAGSLLLRGRFESRVSFEGTEFFGEVDDTDAEYAGGRPPQFPARRNASVE